MPGWTRTVMSSGRRSSTRSIRAKSTVMPPRRGRACPSSEVPAPQPIIGTPWAVQMRAMGDLVGGFGKGHGIGQARRHHSR
jgi:hypothetical protein